MAKKKNTIFISFSSKDIGDKGYVQAVESAIHSIGYEADHMNRGVLDATVIQPELDDRIRRSRLVIMVLDQQYKDCKRLCHEFEEVTQRGNKIKTLIFIKDYNTPNERRNQDENIFNVLKINENRYIRFNNPGHLYEKVKEQLNIWHRDEDAKRKEGQAYVRWLLYAVVVALAGLLFCLFVPYIKSNGMTDGVIVIEDPTGGEDETPTGGEGETPTGGEGETPTGGKGKTPTGGEGEEIIVMIPNTFAVNCDDKLFCASIYDAVSQVLPSFSQPVDVSKAQWTISVEQSSIQEVLKEIDSDALKVDVNYIIEITNNAENKIITKKIENVRGRSINQNREDAIRNANDNASKEILEIIKQCIK